MFCDFVTNTVVQKITSDFSNSSNQFDLEVSEVVSVFQGLASGTAGGICHYGVYYINYIARCLNLQLFQLSLQLAWYCHCLQVNALKPPRR